MNHIMKAKWVLNSISCWFYIFFWMCLYLRMFVFHIGLLSFSSGIFISLHIWFSAQQSCNFSWIDPRLLHSFSKCLLMLHLWVDIWIYGHSSDWPLITVTVLFNSLTVNKRSNSGDAGLFNWLSHPPTSGIEQSHVSCKNRTNLMFCFISRHSRSSVEPVSNYFLQWFICSSVGLFCNLVVL